MGQVEHDPNPELDVVKGGAHTFHLALVDGVHGETFPPTTQPVLTCYY